MPNEANKNSYLQLQTATWRDLFFSMVSTGIIFFILHDSLFAFHFGKTLDSIRQLSASGLILNLWLILWFLSILQFITKRLLTASSILLLFSIIFALINYHKLVLTGSAFILSDLLRSTHFSFFLPYIKNTDWVILTLALLFTGLTLLLPLSKNRPKLGPRFRCFKIVFTLFTGVSLILGLSLNEKLGLKRLLKNLGVSKVAWDQAWNYRSNGVPLGSLLTVFDEFILPPRDYTRERVFNILNSRQSPLSVPPSEKPHILLYMMESLWDPTPLLVHFSQDPIPTFHRLQKEGQAGNLWVPVFGGGTANTEFEVLTGMSTHFQPPDTISYVEYLKNPTESLASIFSKNGYSPLALHNFNPYFYHRNRAYSLLGFKHFYSLDEMGVYQTRRGYPTDQTLVKKIIQVLTEAKSPLLIHAVTMESHGPYDLAPTLNPIKVLDPGLPQELETQIETYASTLWNADESLQILTDALRKLPQKVVLFVYGDHLPSLGEDYAAYRSAHFITHLDASQWSKEEWLKMHSTPLVIWSNHGELKPISSTLSSNCISLEVIKQANLELDPFHQFTKKICQEIPTIPFYDDTNSTLMQTLEDYKILIYDRLLGQRYSESRVGY